MSVVRLLCAVSLIACVPPASLSRQSAAPQQVERTAVSGFSGEVIAVSREAGRLEIKTRAGDVVTAYLGERTVFKRVPPGETTLGNAVDATFGDVNPGDQVFARGRVAEDRKSVAALQLIIMARRDILKKQEQDRAEWQRRGIAGVVSARDAAAQELTLQLPPRDGGGSLVVAATEGTKFLRYDEGSVKFGDAKASSFDKIKVGDHARTLGEKSADGKRFVPEVFVSGTFRTIIGVVKGVNPSANEATVLNSLTGKPLTVVLSRDTALLRLPADTARALVRKAQEGGAADKRVGVSIDLQSVLEQLPPLSLAEVKDGEVVVASTTASDEARVTAIVLVAGAEPFMKVLQPKRSNLSGPAPTAGINLGIGSP